MATVTDVVPTYGGSIYQVTMGGDHFEGTFEEYLAYAAELTGCTVVEGWPEGCDVWTHTPGGRLIKLTDDDEGPPRFEIFWGDSDPKE